MQALEALFCDLPRIEGSNTLVGRCTGLATVLVLVLTGYFVGAETYLLHQSEAQFHQDLFGPAVSLACTGHIDHVDGHAKVEAFLHDPNGSLESCDGVDGARSIYWNVFDTASLYLYALAAIAWTLLGFSWSSLSAVAGFFTAGFVVGAYLFVRCFASSRLLAFALALAVLFAPVAVIQIPHLRDFSKAPLVLLGLGLIGRIVVYRMSFRTAIALAACVGALIGLGSGLRPDATILAPIAFAAFLLLWRDRLGNGTRGKQIVLASLALCLGYLATSAPVMLVNHAKGFTAHMGAHVLILGWAEWFESVLGFQQGNYVMLRDYVDEQAQALVNLHHSGIGAAPLDHSLDADYGSASNALFVDMLASAPRDALLRVFATANALGAYPLNNLVYGPGLALLVMSGVLLLPRRALFYCICSVVIVPVLSLQFNQRHAFYTVVLGAAALGLAYTLAAIATMSLAIGGRFSLPRRRQFAQRGAILLTTTIATAALAYLGDQLVGIRQTRALTAVHEIYREADWSPVALEHHGSELRFPTLMPTAESKVGLMGLSFAFTEPQPTGEMMNDLLWRGTGGATVPSGDEIYRVVVHQNASDQFRSRPIRTSELQATSGAAATLELSIYLRGLSDSEWTIGALALDESKWLDTQDLPSGAFDGRVILHIPRAEEGFLLVWPIAVLRNTHIELDRLDVSSKSPIQECAPTEWSIAATHTYAGASDIGTPIPIPPSRTGTYYFPFSESPMWRFDSVKVDGAMARCITEARVASHLPTGTLPIELVEIDGAFVPTRRASWTAILRDFARWQRPVNF